MEKQNNTFVKFQFDNHVEVDNHDKVNQLIANEMLGYQDGNGDNNSNVDINIDGVYCNNVICSHCLKPGHIIKTCPSAVISYGLICYHKKQITVDSNGQSNNFFNKKTKKQGYMRHGSGNYSNSNSNSNFRKSHNLPRIKILKRNETLNYTLKNMLGLTSAENEIDSLNANEYSIDKNDDTNNN